MNIYYNVDSPLLFFYLLQKIVEFLYFFQFVDDNWLGICICLPFVGVAKSVATLKLDIVSLFNKNLDG